MHDSLSILYSPTMCSLCCLFSCTHFFNLFVEQRHIYSSQFTVMRFHLKKKKKWCAQCAPHLVRLFANGIFESDWRQTICAHLTVSPSNATTFDNFRTHRLTVKVIIMRISLASSEYYPCIGIGIDWHRKNWLHLDTAERHVGEIETSKLYGCLWEWIRLCNWNVLSMRDISFNGNWLCAGW